MTLAPAHPRYRLWPQVYKLLRVSLLMTLKGFTRARLRRKIFLIILGVIVAAVIAGIFAASWGILTLLRRPGLITFVDAELLASSIPTLVLTFAFVVTLTFSFGVLLQGLYLAGDMEFLLSAPVSIRAVFVSKLLQAILPNFGLTSLFALPLLWGLGAANGYSLIYYPLVLLALGAVVLAAAGLSSLLVLGIARVFPPRAVAEVLGLIGGIVAILLSQTGQFSRSIQLGQAQLSQLLQTLTYLNAPWSPLAWAGRGLTDVGAGAWLTGLGALALTVVLCVATFGVALVTAERLYFTGWARLTVAARKKRPARKRTENMAGRPGFIARLAPPAVRGLVLKDTLVLRRDLRSLSQLVGPLILCVIYAAVLLRGGSGEPVAGRGRNVAQLAQVLRHALVYGNVAIALFVGWTLIARLALMSFSHESKNYWIIKAAPVSPDQLLAGKFLIAYLPPLVLGWAFFLVMSALQGTTPMALVFGLLAVALCLAGGAGLYLAFGVAGTNLAWNDPRHMVSGYATCLGTIVTGAYMLLSAALFFDPPFVLILLGQPEVLGQLIGLGLGGLFGLLCTIIPPMLVRQRVARIGEA